MSKAMQIGLAIFFGAAIGGFVAYEASENFWWLGAIVGGGLSWAFYDLKALIAAVTKTAKAAATSDIMELKGLFQNIGSIAFVKIPKAMTKVILFLLASLIACHGYGALIAMIFYTIEIQFFNVPLMDCPFNINDIIAISIPISIMGLFPFFLIFIECIQEEFSPSPRFWKYFLLCGAILAICLSPLWLLVPFCEAVLYPYVYATFVFLSWLTVLGVAAAISITLTSLILYFLPKIIWKAVKLVHCSERLLCLVYGALGVAIAHCLTHGVMIIGLSGLIGAGLGILDYKMLPRRWFEKKTATAFYIDNF